MEKNGMNKELMILIELQTLSIPTWVQIFFFAFFFFLKQTVIQDEGFINLPTSRYWL